MNKLILDFVDKTPIGYIIRYCTKGPNPVYGTIALPINIFNWYKSAKIFDSIDYEIKNLNRSDLITVTKMAKLLTVDDCYYMHIKFNNNSLIVEDKHFDERIKSYCFQSVIFIECIDNNSNLIYNKCKFLKNYNTRSKAVYYTDKFAYRFKMFYHKYFISDEVTFDTSDKNIELIHEDTIYEHKYIFKNDKCITIYTFNIIIIEKE